MPTAGQLRDLISGEPLADRVSLCDVGAESLRPSGDVCILKDQYEYALSVGRLGTSDNASWITANPLSRESSTYVSQLSQADLTCDYRICVL